MRLATKRLASMHLRRSVSADLFLWVVVLALNQTVALPLVVRPKGRVAKPANDPGMTFGTLTLDDTIAHYQVLRRDRGHRSAVDESGCSTCPTH